MYRPLCLSLAVLAVAYAADSVWDGIYTNDQAEKGASAYSANCASCHGSKLEGKGPTPPLGGPDFIMNWTGMTMGDLFLKIQTSMPADRPGQVSKEDNAAILAYILKANKFPAGATPLSPDADALNKIRFDAGRQSK